MNTFQSFGWETNPNLNYNNKNFPSLNEDINTDWLVIGGGLTGLSALNQLKKYNITDKVIMVDAGKIGQGSSSRNSGFLVDSTLNNGATTISNIKDYKQKYAGIPQDSGATPIYASNKQQLMELIQGKSDPKPKHMITNITTYKTILKQAELEDKFELSYQMPSKTPQAFVFGSNINQELKKAINVEIAKLNRSGLTEQIEKDWRD